MRIASYNLHKCVGADGRRDVGRTIEALNALGADIVALQEVDRRLGARPAALPPRLLEADTDLVPAPLAVSPGSLGWHGQTILVRRGLSVRRVERIELPGLEPRGAVLAELELPGGGEIRVAGVHLGLLRSWRRRQLARLCGHLELMPSMPTAILGDYNEWTRARGLEPLSARHAVHAPGRTFPAGRPVASLDRIALGSGLTLRDSGVVQTALTRRASDHLPIWAEVALPKLAENKNKLAQGRNNLAHDMHPA